MPFHLLKDKKKEKKASELYRTDKDILITRDFTKTQNYKRKLHKEMKERQ